MEIVSDRLKAAQQASQESQNSNQSEKMELSEGSSVNAGGAVVGLLPTPLPGVEGSTNPAPPSSTVPTMDTDSRPELNPVVSAVSHPGLQPPQTPVLPPRPFGLNRELIVSCIIYYCTSSSCMVLEKNTFY